MLWLCQVRGNSLGFVSRKANEPQLCACSWMSVKLCMEGERSFHPLGVTADEHPNGNPLPIHAHHLNERNKTPISSILFEVLKNSTC